MEEDGFDIIPAEKALRTTQAQVPPPVNGIQMNNMVTQIKTMIQTAILSRPPRYAITYAAARQYALKSDQAIAVAIMLGSIFRKRGYVVTRNDSTLTISWEKPQDSANGSK